MLAVATIAPSPQARTPDSPPDPGPARALRRRLAELRRHGLEFDAIWILAVDDACRVAPSGERRRWRAVFSEHRSIWEAAFNRELEPWKLSPGMIETPTTGQPHSASEPAVVA